MTQLAIEMALISNTTISISQYYIVYITNDDEIQFYIKINLKWKEQRKHYNVSCKKKKTNKN